MELKQCKFCNKSFNVLPHSGAKQEYCEPNHRRYENQLKWLLKKKAEALHNTLELPLDGLTKKKIEEAVELTIKHYGETLKKLGNS